MGRNNQNSKWAAHQTLDTRPSNIKIDGTGHVREFDLAETEVTSNLVVAPLEPETEVNVPVIEETPAEVKSEAPAVTEEATEELPIQEEPKVELKPITKKSDGQKSNKKD